MIPDLLLSRSALRGWTGSKESGTYTIIHTLTLYTQVGTFLHHWSAVPVSFGCSIICYWTFLWHYATKNKRQLLRLKPAALPPLCLSLTQWRSASTSRKGNGSTSLKNVHNGLWCDCRSNQTLLLLLAKVLPSSTGRCWAQRKCFWVIPTTWKAEFQPQQLLSRLNKDIRGFQLKWLQSVDSN